MHRSFSPAILPGIGRVVAPVRGPFLPPLLRLAGQRRHASVGRVHDQRRPPGTVGRRSAIQPEVVCRRRVRRPRRGRTLPPALRSAGRTQQQLQLAVGGRLPRGPPLLPPSENSRSAVFLGPLERRYRPEIPDAVQGGVTPGRSGFRCRSRLRRPGQRGQRQDRDNKPYRCETLSASSHLLLGERLRTRPFMMDPRASGRKPAPLAGSGVILRRPAGWPALARNAMDERTVGFYRTRPHGLRNGPEPLEGGRFRSSCGDVFFAIGRDAGGGGAPPLRPTLPR